VGDGRITIIHHIAAHHQQAASIGQAAQNPAARQTWCHMSKTGTLGVLAWKN
jgi:hypothetical protein